METNLLSESPPLCQDETGTTDQEQMDEIQAIVNEDIKLEFGDALLTLWKMSYDSDALEPVCILPITDDVRISHLTHLAHYTKPSDAQENNFTPTKSQPLAQNSPTGPFPCQDSLTL